MKISEIIALADKMKPNGISYPIKAALLSRLDGMIFHEVIMTHEGHPDAPFREYGEEDAELIVPFPYGESVYLNYLFAEIDKLQKDDNGYNRYITLYNSAYLDFQSYYNRTHMPISHGNFHS